MSQILVRALAIVGVAVTLSGCGQAGALYLPTSPAAADRATLPQSLLPDALSPRSAAAQPSTKASAPR